MTPALLVQWVCAITFSALLVMIVLFFAAALGIDLKK